MGLQKIDLKRQRTKWMFCYSSGLSVDQMQISVRCFSAISQLSDKVGRPKISNLSKQILAVLKHSGPK